jgi:hypothetical protein
VGRASLRDKGSVALSRDLVEALLGELMKFDFRNGMEPSYRKDRPCLTASGPKARGVE